MKKFNLVITGPQGSGKGTQAKLLGKKFNLYYICPGDLLRKFSKKRTKEAEKIKLIIKSGKLVPNDLTKKLIEDELSHLPQDKGVIFDGYPRNPNQVKDLKEILKKRKVKTLFILVLNISEKTSFYRLENRRICQKCKITFYPPKSLKKKCPLCGGRLIRRSDDTEKIIKKRLDLYYRQTKKILSYFRQDKEEVIEINGEPEIKEVTKSILKKLEKRLKSG